MDKYDLEIERLVEQNGRMLQVSWSQWGPLFDVVTGDCGCLTMIRGSIRKQFSKICPAANAAITAIRLDGRLPASLPLDESGACWVPDFENWDGLSVEERREFLKPFAEWQRALDATIRQGKPWHPEFAPGKNSESTVHKTPASRSAVPEPEPVSVRE